MPMPTMERFSSPNVLGAVMAEAVGLLFPQQIVWLRA